MKNAIIVHGKPGKEEYYNPVLPSPSNYHWIPWIQKQLIIKDIAAHTPEIPFAYNPEYSIWQKEFERFELTQETILVDHSCGGGFLVRWLSEHPAAKVGKIVLVSPSLGYGWESQKEFFDFVIDEGLVTRAKGITIFTSDNDKPNTRKSSEEIAEKLKGSKLIVLKNHGHFTHIDMKTNEFPELLEECLK